MEGGPSPSMTKPAARSGARAEWNRAPVEYINEARRPSITVENCWCNGGQPCVGVGHEDRQGAVEPEIRGLEERKLLFDCCADCRQRSSYISNGRWRIHRAVPEWLGSRHGKKLLAQNFTPHSRAGQNLDKHLPGDAWSQGGIAALWFLRSSSSTWFIGAWATLSRTILNLARGFG